MSVYWSRTGIIYGCITVYDLILRSIHIQQGVEQGEAGGFGRQVILVGEGLVHGGLGFLELSAGVRQVILRALQAGGQALKGIVQALDVTVEVGAQRCCVAQAADQGDLVLPAQGIEIQLHSKAPIPSQGNRVWTLHGMAGFQDRGACRFLFSIDSPLDLHGTEAVLIRMAADLDTLDVVGVALLPLFQISNLLDLILDIEKATCS